MKRFLEILAVVAVIVAAAVVAYVAVGSRDHSDKSSSAADSANHEKTSPADNKACGIFTLALAKQLLGDTAKGGASTTNASSEDISVSSCTYAQTGNTRSTVATRKTATLLARAPLTLVGTNSNRNQFGQLKPDNAQDVSGYGDNAYWAPDLAQLNILKNNNWYVLTYGPASPAGRTLDQTRQLADLLIGRL